MPSTQKKSDELLKREIDASVTCKAEELFGGTVMCDNPATAIMFWKHKCDGGGLNDLLPFTELCGPHRHPLTIGKNVLVCALCDQKYVDIRHILERMEAL